MKNLFRYNHIVFGAVLLFVSILLLYFSPDIASMVFIGIMIGLVSLGYCLGIVRVNNYATGFHFAMKKMKGLKAISTEENWIYIKQLHSFFNYSGLDKIFKKYYKEVEMTKEESTCYVSDIDSVINEEVIEVKCFKSLVDGIPGILTGLGILGTFYGLIQGLGGIRFSSVNVVVESISVLVSGIDTAFFTSIAGVILSVLFEMMIKVEWNTMIDSMFDFVDLFHSVVIPSLDVQKQKQEIQFQQDVLKKLDEVLHETKK